MGTNIGSITTNAGVRTFVGVVCLTMVGCGGEAPDQERQTIRPAKIIQVESSRPVRTLTYPALVEAASSAEVTFQVAGLLQELPVASGQLVKEGDLIARLDERDFRNELASAEARYKQAQSAFSRSERLLEQSATSRRNFEQAKTERDVALATLNTARKRLEDATLLSPFDGLIAAVHGERFQNVAPQEPIVTLQTTGTADAIIQVPASVVATSSQFEVEETVVLLDALPGVRIPAVYQSAQTEADAESQTFRIRYAFEPPEGLVVLPGMTGMVESRIRFVRQGDLVEVPAVPTSAILSDGESNYVWLVDTGTMTVSRRDVTVAPGVGEMMGVLDGLQEGDVIVGAGAAYLHEGMQIRSYEP